MRPRLDTKVVIYVYAPRLGRNKAGVRVLYALTHKLREMGFDASIVCHSIRKGQFGTELHAPTWKILKNLFSSRKIITIYPESIIGNLFPIGIPVRYLLSMPGELLTNNNSLIGDKNTFAYSKNLARAWKCSGPVVHLPTVNFEELEVFTGDPLKNYDLVYSGKYLDLHKMSLPIDVMNCQVLLRKEIKQLNRRDFLRKIYDARRVYCLENTTVALEALMFGVPVVMIKNEKFKELILEDEFGGFGLAKSVSHVDISKAEETVGLAKETYLDYLSRIEFGGELSNWISNVSNQEASISKTRRTLRVLFSFRIIRAIRHKVYFFGIFRKRGKE